TLFAGYKNMWRSTNITSSPPTWVKISSGETVNCEVIEQSPVNLDLLYAVRSGSMKRTENANDAAGSVTWTSCTLPGGGTPTDLVAHPTDANTVYATVNYGVYKSTDKGATWTNITGNLPGLFINCLAYDKTTNEGLYVGNQTGVWYKDATMSNWMLFSNGLPPADVRELEIYYDANPSNNRIKAGTFGRGMWQSDMAAVTVIDPTAFSAYAANSAQINLGWTKNAANDNVLIAVSSTGTFGQPEDGTAYSAGNALPAGGTVLYNGSASGYNHTGLSVNTKYYYKAWSVNGSAQYSAGLAPISATTDCQALNSFPYICTFDNTDCWQVIDNTGNGSWLFGSTSNSSNPPTLLTSPYAYFMSSPGSPVNYNSDLISPPFDFSSHGTVVLKFNQHYDGDAVWSSIARVYYTADNGLNWNLLATYTTDQNNIPVAILVPGAAGQSNVKFKWNYFDDATGSYFWGIDDVQVVECSGVWTGSVSTNWHTAGNWCNNSVPTTTTDVYIPAGVTNFPDISTSATAYCRDITIQSGATLKMSAANSVLEVKGNWTMHGSFDFTYSSTSAMVKFNGSSPQSVGGSTYTKLRGFTIDNTSGVTTSIELRADNAIQLINGIVTTTGSGKVYDVYSVIVRTNGWVNGTLQKYLWTGNTSVENRTFQIGDATRYAPVALSFPISSITATGPISMKTTAGDHTSIGASTLDGSLSVNRYWSFPSTGTFTSCTATFNFVNDDLDAGTLTGNLNAGMYKSGSWTYPTVGTRTSTSIQITGFASTNLTDIQLAETVPSITWGNLQWPANGNIALGGTFNVYGQVYLGGVTPGAGAGAGMQSWVGYSTSNTDPSGWTNWVPATYNVDNGNNDEYMANLGASITAPGTWYYAMRYKRGSSSYVYGGYSAGGGGLWDGSTYVSGVLTVTGPTFTGTGNWTDAARWSTGAVPASTVSTIIDGTCTISSAVTTADLTINSGRSVIVASNGQFTVNGLLTNNAGTTGLVIKSDVTGTGSLIHSTGGVPGTAERYIANDWKWHFLASPVLAQPVWTEFSPAPTGTPLSFGSSSWNWDFYYWNPNADTSTGLYWVNLRKENGDYNDGTIDETGNNAGFGTSTPPVMTPGRGYLAAYNTGWTTGSPVTHQFSGSLNEGSISCPVSINSNKFNLAGNPYPSAVDWQATGGWSRTNLALNGSGYDYWIYNDNAGNYGVFNSSTGSGTNGTSRYIASGQAFFVKATSAGSLGMTDAVRVHSTQAWLKNTDEDPSAVRLQLTSTANAYSDEMIVAFNPAFVPGGSEKLRSFYDEAPEIWSVSGSREYSIVRYTQPSDELVVPVSIKAGVTAGFTITSPGVTGFGLSSRVYLEDLKTGMTQDLKSNPVYSFSASPGDVPERFRLHFGAPFGIGNEDNRSCLAIWITGKKIRIKSENGCMSDGELSIFNILGQEMIHQRLSGTETTVPMDERPGYYIVKVVTDRQTIVRKVFIPM
ncbi:MAG TPA: T9SS type A sorting domain-containing protein, partial [Bacteroidales bacterium]|nr:T9SS type A sorting domain-containing protein [Bacteroidales bacterium]